MAREDVTNLRVEVALDLQDQAADLVVGRIGAPCEERLRPFMPRGARAAPRNERRAVGGRSCSATAEAVPTVLCWRGLRAEPAADRTDDDEVKE
jgi:hypothetical protein